MSEVSLNLKPRKYRLRTSASLPKFPTTLWCIRAMDSCGQRRYVGAVTPSHCDLSTDCIVTLAVQPPRQDRLAGQVVKTSAPKAEGSEFESRLRRDFSGSSHTSDLRIGTPAGSLPGAWCHRVRAGTGLPGVSIL